MFTDIQGAAVQKGDFILVAHYSSTTRRETLKRGRVVAVHNDPGGGRLHYQAVRNRAGPVDQTTVCWLDRHCHGRLMVVPEAAVEHLFTADDLFILRGEHRSAS